MNKILNKKNALGILGTTLLLLFVFFSCSDNKKGLMTLTAVASDIPIYKTAFAKYFEVGSIDASQYGYSFTIVPSRYWVCIITSEGFANLEVSSVSFDEGFFIPISDDGRNVEIQFIYNVGAAEENPVIINPNMIKGKVTVRQTVTLSPKNAKGTSERAVEIVNAVYQKLVEIEGK